MKMLTIPRSLTVADLKNNLHDIQDNVVSPILMRYGRHVFLRFNDGARARAWLRVMFDRVNARQEEHGTRFTVNIGFTWEGLKALGLSQWSLNSFPEAFRAGMRGRSTHVGDVGLHAPEHWEGGLGGPGIHAMGWIRTDSEEGREVATAVRRHRLIRRGVEYGPRLPDGVLENDGIDRGLINLFIQADIERQFEFVQLEWMKGGEFIGLDPNEQDPINGSLTRGYPALLTGRRNVS
jgi:deferrochelatase/peroxidase EfeB